MHALHKFLLFHVLTCLGLNADGSEIINGEEVPEGSMLYMASLQNNGHHVCGGFLINEDFVVTAAHCAKYGPTHVVLGTHNLKGAGKISKKIKQRYIPERYRSEGEGNDIMLLNLAEKAGLNDSVQTIQIPTSEMNITVNENCRVAGWGLTETGEAVDDLRVVNVSIIDREVCKNKWQGNSNYSLPANVICAGGYNTSKGFCQGDSGGPLVCNGKAVGVVSFNNRNYCKYPDIPNVYTDISKHLTWINEVREKKDWQM